jgi:hypothetical protein
MGEKISMHRLIKNIWVLPGSRSLCEVEVRQWFTTSVPRFCQTLYKIPALKALSKRSMEDCLIFIRTGTHNNNCRGY